MHIYIDIYLYLYIPKYDLLSLHNVTCVFRANYLVLDNQLVSSSPGKTISPLLTQHSLAAVVLCIGLKPCRLPDIVISSGPSAHVPCLLFLRAEVWGKPVWSRAGEDAQRWHSICERLWSTKRKPCVGWLVREKAFARLNMYMKTF